MTILRFCLLAALVAPGAAHAASASMVTRELPAANGAYDARFDLVGLHWQGSGRVAFRARSLAGRWGVWEQAAPEADEPDAGSEARRSRGWRLGSPFWTGASDRLEYRTWGDVRRVRAFFVRSVPRSAPLARRVAAAGSPRIVRRAAWAADEEIRRASPRYARKVRLAVVHHTAGTNVYEPSESAAIVLGIELYHVKANGWNDIGYNFLVDRYGQIFEGRHGGVARNVVGAHAAGFNTGSVGVAVLGTYGREAITPAARAALVRLLAWRLDVAHADPLASLGLTSRGNERYGPGVDVPLRAVSGHRDTGLTECPGNRLYAQLDSIARKVAETGLPKLYEPSVTGELGAEVRFAARLSSPAAWTVTITDAAGGAVARGRGSGSVVDWAWKSAAARNRSYRWTIEAGPAMRPASGTIGPGPAPPPTPPAAPPPALKPPSPLLSNARAAPATVSPNGDGQADETVVTYTLARPAVVTARVLDAAGAEVVTLFSEQRQSARRQSWGWAPEALADGRYALLITAVEADGRSAMATLSVLVDRTLGRFAAAPAAFSPNGDGRDDAIVFSFELAVSALVSLRAVKSGRGAGLIAVGFLAAGPHEVVWDGAVADRTLPDGRYEALLAAAGAAGESQLSMKFTIGPA
ncbi:MAG: peptidoglycan recognition protein [Actinobacteria bacterium]|nr:peptidoglycan recognition protein [Actinomycetota bacterium]